MSSELSLDSVEVSETKFIFLRVHPDEISESAKELLEESERYDDDRPGLAAIIDKLENGHSQLWEFKYAKGHGVVLTSVLNKPTGNELRMWRVIGHNMYDYLNLMEDAMIKFAKDEGCIRITSEVVPRLGLKICSEHGYTLETVRISKDI